MPEVDQTAWMLTNGGLSSASIGFAPNWDTVEKILGSSGIWRGGLRFNESELLECSVVGIPANPDALVKDSGSVERRLDEARQRVLRRQERNRVVALLRAGYRL